MDMTTTIFVCAGHDGMGAEEVENPEWCGPLSEWLHNNPETIWGEIEALRDDGSVRIGGGAAGCFTVMTAKAREALLLAPVIEKARNRYVNERCEIDAEPAVSIADDGCWVAAWVWVPNEGSL